jgi:transcriptional regulator with XRE-family HTH domain
MTKKPINRIKTVLVDQGKTNKWLASKLKKSPTTVSRWCTNEMQPSLETLVLIANTLNVNICELLYNTREK